MKDTTFIEDAKKRLLSLFNEEDVFIDKNEFDGIVVRPKPEYNENYDRSFLIRIPPAGRSISTADHLQLDEKTCVDARILCSGIKSYDLSSDLEPVIFQIKYLIIEYNKAIKNWKILHKNRKIAEIRGICDKFTV